MADPSKDSRYLYRHIEFLAGHDADFMEFWREQETLTQWAYLETFQRVEHARVTHLRSLDTTHARYAETMQAAFSDIAQVPMDFSALGKDYALYLANTARKFDDLNRFSASLSIFMTGLNLGSKAYWYGRLKSTNSLNRKLQRLGQSHSGTFADRLLLDAVRFRIVVADLNLLHRAAEEIPAYFSNRVLACRNYILRPRYGIIADRYKAIHYIIATEADGYPIEIQMMSQNREAASILDHHVGFKERSLGVRASQKEWLLQFATAANILDGQSFAVHTIASSSSNRSVLQAGS